MYEKVNPSHPDKIADRIAGAIVDIAYSITDNPHIAVEVLLGHGDGFVIIESDVEWTRGHEQAMHDAIARITGLQESPCTIMLNAQDAHLNANQSDIIRCGDNGIFKGMPITREQAELTKIAKDIYAEHPSDGKYIIDGSDIVICQSNVDDDFQPAMPYKHITTNPIGQWTGGIDVDSGATNRKLGSDMGDAVTGGGLHGKDLSKADVTLNIYAHIQAQKQLMPVELCCAIGDEKIDGKPYSEIVEIARKYVQDLGGFEKLAEWGLIR